MLSPNTALCPTRVFSANSPVRACRELTRAAYSRRTSSNLSISTLVPSPTLQYSASPRLRQKIFVPKPGAPSFWRAGELLHPLHSGIHRDLPEHARQFAVDAQRCDPLHSISHDGYDPLRCFDTRTGEVSFELVGLRRQYCTVKECKSLHRPELQVLPEGPIRVYPRAPFRCRYWVPTQRSVSYTAWGAVFMPKRQRT